MIRRFIDWLLYTLHIKKRQRVDALKSLTELLPILTATVALVSMWKRIGPLLPKIPWYRFIWQKTRYHVKHARAIIVGY